MPESKTVTGHTLVMVKLANGGEVAVHRGEQLPEGLADGELERLDKVGAFDPPRQANLALQGASPAPGSVLPPQMTLAANPEPTDGPLLPSDDADVRELFSAEEKAEAARLAAEKAEPNVNPQAPPDPVTVVVPGVTVSSSSTNTVGPTPPPPPPAPAAEKPATKAAAPPKK